VFTLGLHVKTHRAKRVVCGLVLDADNTPVLPITHIPNPSHNKATQAKELHHTLTTALRGRDIRAAVLLEADYHPRRGLTDGIIDRLRLEGICLAATRETVTVVEVMDGPALGRACGTTKSAAVSAAQELLIDSVLIEAAAAAMAARAIA
jgi:hypothetical protein